MTPERLAELKALAEKATPGPWKHGPGSQMVSTRPVPDVQNCSGFSLVCRSGLGSHARDAEFIAALDPQTVLALIAAAERPFVVPAAGITDAEGKAFDFPDATGRIERLPSDTTALERDRDEALAQVAALREHCGRLASYLRSGESMNEADEADHSKIMSATAAAARAHDAEAWKRANLRALETVKNCACPDCNGTGHDADDRDCHGCGGCGTLHLLNDIVSRVGALVPPPSAAEPQREGATPP